MGDYVWRGVLLNVLVLASELYANNVSPETVDMTVRRMNAYALVSSFRRHGAQK